MARRRHPRSAVPAETARVAQAIFPKGHLSMTRRDTLGTLDPAEDVADVCPPPGPPAACPWRLAWIGVRPWGEHGSARQAAEAVRRRMDWT